MERVQSEMNMVDLTICYGMTETSPVSWQSRAGNTPFDKLISTVGLVHPHAECKVVDVGGETVPVGTTGELLTRGYLVMDGGYWGDDSATAHAVNGGWMHTGDLGYIDAEGYCTIIGRAKDTIIRGGENIAPVEIENVLFAHPDIVQVSCVGVADTHFGEEICACVVLRRGTDTRPAVAESIRELCREQLAHFKTPRYVRFVDSFPMTVSGKVQKHVLRSLSAKDLGLVSTG